MEEYLTVDIESQRIEEEIKNREARKKNDEELDRICKNICLICGWSLVVVLIIYTIMMIIFK
jgi:hypothetical protein